MTPAEKSDADELPARSVEVIGTPDEIEARATERENCGAAHAATVLRALAFGIREGERRAAARIVAALSDITWECARRVANLRGGDAELVREIAQELADDIEAGRL